MKIGILTFHCAHNYGAVLQCYATQKFLQQNGYDVEIINYRPQYLLEPYRIFTIRRFLSRNPIYIIKSILWEFILFPIRLKRYIGFEKFIKEKLNVSHKITDVALLSKYDIFIVGSDQIWNSKISCGFDDVYFCNFPFDKKNKKYISYAASIELGHLDNEGRQYLSTQLKHFDKISVREVDAVDILNSITKKSVFHVLDPTLMVSSDLWDAFPKTTMNEKYVLVYQVRKNENTIRIAKEIADQIGAKIKVLVAWLQPELKDTNQIATPEEFIDNIRNASCIITTSFHGTAFSTINKKPFYTVRLNDGADNRSDSLLRSLRLEDRIINFDDSPVFSRIDYSQVYPILEELRQNSQEYLLDSLRYE